MDEAKEKEEVSVEEEGQVKLEELKEWKERALRYAAELENLKKSFKREREEYFKFALETVFKELLPSIDNLEMALKSFETSSNVEALKQGVELTLKVLVQTLEKFGLKQFEPAVGEPFHPHFHEALHVEPHPEVPNGGITKVFQKGYKLHERVLRPALVCVCQGSPVNKEEKSLDENNQIENE
ncbi:co-chaperone GrpE [Caldimicrobium thiodismutans]|jgi:molecular chaperone GrpE|uniref:Protein GrpE n=1 Tax=Caldimicrobium thiodismutans TaxID=1653476 RepID=A0A0U5AFD0_9BACT|nr:nucleotide exchange factor GrpE [Caldimicrobium thiodismutans]BAU22711.1 co-chaperone GrpE [Caldimicrobium thiodismutans]